MARTFAYDDFRITFGAAVDGVHPLRAVDPTGGVVDGSFAVPLADDVLVATLTQLSRTHTRHGAPTVTRDVGNVASTAPDARRLGATLADALLAGDIGARYAAACASAERAGRGLRLTLSLDQAPELLTVPWEFLYRPPVFVASQRDTPVVRVLEVGPDTSPPTISADVRILGVIANPVDLSRLDVAAERRRVEQALAPMIELGRVTLEWLDPATPRRLREVLRDGNYHVLHFVGHSAFSDDGEGVLFLEDAAGASAPVNGVVLANLLAEQSDLRLVVLNSCSAARTTVADPYAGVATSLIQLGVPAVVAMQFPISDIAAITFGEELFTNLIARQQPIDAAVAEARKAIFVEVDDVEWATPVLFLRDPDVELLHFVRAPVAERRRARTRWIVAAAAVLVTIGVVATFLLTRDGGGDANTANVPTRRDDYALVVEDPGGARRLWLAQADLAAPTPVAEELTGDLTTPDWHPALEQLVFRRTVEGASTGCEVCVLDPASGSVVALAARQADRTQHAPTWEGGLDGADGPRIGAYFAATNGCDPADPSCDSDVFHVAEPGAEPRLAFPGVRGVRELDADPQTDPERWELLVMTSEGTRLIGAAGSRALHRGDEVGDASYSRNGNRIVGITRNGTSVRVWNNNGGDITSELHAEETIEALIVSSDTGAALGDLGPGQVIAVSISTGFDPNLPATGEFAVLLADITTREALAIATVRADDEGPDRPRVSIVDVRALPFELRSAVEVRAVAQ